LHRTVLPNGLKCDREEICFAVRS